jgi:protein required for attachment to host cells
MPGARSLPSDLTGSVTSVGIASKAAKAAICDPKERLVVVVGTAAPGELRKYYREQIQDIVYGATVR